MRRTNNTNNTNWLFALVVIMCLFGIVMVASSSQVIAWSMHKDTLYYFKRQIAFLFAGGILCYLFSRYDYKKLEKKAIGIFAVTIVLLVAVFIIGKEAGGSSRWIPLGFFNLQPSEVAKLGSIILIASIISKKRIFKTLVDYKPFVALFIMAGLILAQPDFGTAVLIMLTALVTLFACGIEKRQFYTFLAGFGTLGMITIMSSGYRRQRFFAFLNPWADIKGSGFQIIQSIYALGSGGIFGVGLAQGKQKFNFLPAAYTDFIFAIIGEELGLFGTVLVVLLFAFLTFIGMGIAASCRDPFGKALATAITLSIIIQGAINLGACIGILPITGVPLPLISYGGSSMLITLSSLGILLNISKQNSLREDVG